jgi:hypothetical protein
MIKFSVPQLDTKKMNLIRALECEVSDVFSNVVAHSRISGKQGASRS